MVKAHGARAKIYTKRRVRAVEKRPAKGGIVFKDCANGGGHMPPDAWEVMGQHG